LDLKLGIGPKAGNFLSGKREGEGGGGKTEIGRWIDRERERERERLNQKGEDLVKRYDKGNMHVREKEREREREREGGGKER
jgi:hypothetical protein